MSRRSPLAALRRDRTVRAVVAVAALALAARLVFLGARVAHQDEARVGFWTVRYAISGQFEYRPIVHGPFIPVVNRHLFAAFGASDFVARLPMALLGGIAPLGALLFRGRLRDSETVAFGLLLAANPVFLYYSRFMRQDVPLAVFALFALGLAVRALDADGFRWRRRYVLLSALALGLAFTTKENAVLYPVAWAGAALLVADVRLTRYDAVAEASALAAVRSWVRETGPWRVGGGVAFLVGNPFAVFLLGVPGQDGGFLRIGAFVFLVALGLLGYLLAVESRNPVHYLAAVPLAVLAAVGLLGAVFGGPVAFGAVEYVYDRFLVYYAVSWLLGGVLLLDVAAVSGIPTGRTPDPRGIAPDGGDDRATPATGEGTVGDERNPATEPTDGSTVAAAGRRDRQWYLPPMLGGFLLFFAVVIFFYAPRGGGYPATPGDTGGWGLYSALAALDPAGMGAVLWEATVGTWTEFAGTWASGGHQDHAYIPFFLHYVKTLAFGALVVSTAGGVGILIDRYGEGGPRDLVQFAGYWGIASVVGYPLVTDIMAPWSTVHAVVPLAIPAAVALGLVYRTAAGSLAADDRVGFLLACGVALLVAVPVGYLGVTAVYLGPQSPDNQLVQYAQSSSTDLKPVLEDVKAVARDNEGVDVLYYGDDLHGENESDNDLPYAGGGWFGRLPLAWYTETWVYEWRDQPSAVVIDSTTVGADVGESGAPVVVALGERPSGEDAPTCRAEWIERYLDGYRKYCGHRYLYDSGTTSTVVIFVDGDVLEDPAGTYDGVVEGSVGTGGNASSGSGDGDGVGPGTPIDGPFSGNGTGRIEVPHALLAGDGSARFEGY